jgi:hypothetical protein
MVKLIGAAAVAALLAGAAFAQSGTREEAQMLLTQSNVDITIPEDATDEQVAQIVAAAQGSDQKTEELTMQVKKILGMSE